MERRLKERLVGAAILVVLIVLVVPELLSGPKGNGGNKPSATAGIADPRSEPTRTVTVDLNTQKTMSFDAPQEESATASAPSADPSPSVPPPTPATLLPVPGPAAPVLPAAGPASGPRPVAPPATLASPMSSAAIEHSTASPRSWTLQLGSFSNRANAEQLVRIVKARNSPVYLSASGTGKSLRYRVRVGPLADHAAAERMLAKLKSEGHVATVVAP